MTAGLRMLQRLGAFARTAGLRMLQRLGAFARTAGPSMLQRLAGTFPPTAAPVGRAAGS